MRTLIVLCAGSRMIEHIPLYLNRHPDGKLFVKKAIEGIFIENYDRIIITVRQDAENDFHVTNILLSELNEYPIEIFVLDKVTYGPAHTVYETLKQANVEGEFAVRDSLNGINITKDVSGNFLAGLDLVSTNVEIKNVKSKSFIILNEQSQVLDVVEKRFRSDVISVGLYGFKSAEDFCFAYEHLNDINYPIAKLYVSNIISYLIGYKDRIFHCVTTDFHEDWGSQETWALLQKEYATCFINLDLFFDMTKENFILNNQLQIDYLKSLKMKYVFYTVRQSTDEIKKKLEMCDVPFVDIIGGITLSKHMMMINSLKELENFSLGV